MYRRVVPRDLFNESKLLKCLGQLALLIHDGRDRNGRQTPSGLAVEHDGEEFRIDQREEDGGLCVVGLEFKAGSNVLDLYSAYNSKDPYPLLCRTEDHEFIVFNDDGTLTDEFCEYVADLG